MDNKKTINEYITINASHFNRIMPDTKNREFKIDIIWNNISFAESNIFNTVSHIHSFYELYCVMDGSIKIIMNNKELTLKKNDCVLFPPNCEHRIIDYSTDFVRYDIGFRVSNASFIENVISTEKNDGYCFTMTDEMKFLLKYMNKYAVMNNLYSPSAIGNAICAFVIDVLNQINSGINDDEKNKKTYQTSLAYAAREFIQDNYERQITPSDVSNILHISNRQLSRILKKYYNMSFSGLLELFRIENAKKYLENSDLTIKEIAFLTGYSNEYTFIRAFNRVVGETPGKYKSQIDV